MQAPPLRLGLVSGRTADRKAGSALRVGLHSWLAKLEAKVVPAIPLGPGGPAEGRGGRNCLPGLRTGEMATGQLLCAGGGHQVHQ